MLVTLSPGLASSTAEQIGVEVPAFLLSRPFKRAGQLPYVLVEIEGGREASYARWRAAKAWS